MDYLDTSILTAYYCAEARSLRVQRLLARLAAPAVSPLVEVELAGAVARKVRAGDLAPAAARRIFALFQQHLAEPRFRLVPIQAAEYRLARQWIEALSTPLRALDALHLAAASNQGLNLLTADRVLAEAARTLGVRCRLVP